jgi:DNA-binding response OmpR family regulator
LDTDPIADLRQRVEDLELMCGVTQAPEFIPAMQAFGLTATEARLACLLFKFGFVSRTRAHHHLYGDADCSVGTMKVYVSRLREKLKPHGIQIDTVHGEGWQMGHEAKERFAARLA